jgi:hypothetical protein
MYYRKQGLVWFHVDDRRRWSINISVQNYRILSVLRLFCTDVAHMTNTQMYNRQCLMMFLSISWRATIYPPTNKCSLLFSRNEMNVALGHFCEHCLGHILHSTCMFGPFTHPPPQPLWGMLTFVHPPNFGSLIKLSIFLSPSTIVANRDIPLRKPSRSYFNTTPDYRSTYSHLPTFMCSFSKFP